MVLTEKYINPQIGDIFWCYNKLHQITNFDDDNKITLIVVFSDFVSGEATCSRDGFFNYINRNAMFKVHINELNKYIKLSNELNEVF